MILCRVVSAPDFITIKFYHYCRSNAIFSAYASASVRVLGNAPGVIPRPSLAARRRCGNNACLKRDNARGSPPRVWGVWVPPQPRPSFIVVFPASCARLMRAGVRWVRAGYSRRRPRPRFSFLCVHGHSARVCPFRAWWGMGASPLARSCLPALSSGGYGTPCAGVSLRVGGGVPRPLSRRRFACAVIQARVSPREAAHALLGAFPYRRARAPSGAPLLPPSAHSPARPVGGDTAMGACGCRASPDEKTRLPLPLPLPPRARSPALARLARRHRVRPAVGPPRHRVPRAASHALSRCAPFLWPIEKRPRQTRGPVSSLSPSVSTAA